MKTKPWFICLFIALFLLGLSTASQAADYYVDASTTEGNVVGDGTSEATAWQTITYALTQITTEGTRIIHVASGEYTASMTGSIETFPIALGSDLKLTGPGTGIVTIDAADAGTDTFTLASNSTIEGVTIRNSSGSSFKYGVNLAGTNNLVKNCTIEAAAYGGTIKIDAVYNKVSGCTISKTGSTISYGPNYVTANGNYATFESNSIDNAVNAEGLYFASGAENAQVRGNSITSEGDSIYFGGGNHYASVEGNTIFVAASRDGIQFYASAGAADDIYIYNNTFAGASSTNLSTDALWVNAWGTIASNEVRGCGYGIDIKAVDNNVLNIENNTIVGCERSVYSGAPDGTVNIKNNILSAVPGLGGAYIDDSIAVHNGSTGTLNSTYNCLFNNETGHSGTIGTESDNISSCPRFYDVGNDDYRLFSDSPCLTGGEGGGRMGRYGSAGEASQITTESWASPGASGDGSPGSPWSLTAAVTLTATTIHVNPGTYNPGAGESFPIELGNSRRMTGTGEAILDEDAETNMSTVNMGSYSTIEGVRAKNNNGSNYAAVTPAGEWNLINNCTLEAGNNAHLIYDRFAGSGDGGGYNTITNNRFITSEGANAYPLTLWGDFCTIEGNTLNARIVGGAAIELAGAGPQVKDNSITAIAGNGVNFTGANASIEGNTIILQTAGTDGISSPSGAYYFCVINNKVIGASSTNTSGDGIDLTGYGSVISNEVRTFGYGIDAYNPSGGDITLDRNTVVKCKTGITRSWTSNTVYVKNCVVSSQPEGGGGIAGSVGVTKTNGAINVAYSNVYGNETEYSGDITMGSGTISAIAQFASVEANDYHLNYNSPCIDSGDPASAADPDGSRADMGCYPFDLTVSGTMAVYVKSPNGGESLSGLSTAEITWYATKEGAAYDHIEIYYSTDEGSTFAAIDTDEENDGLYVWTVPNLSTTEARVRITAVGSSATDESDANFTINAATDYYVSTTGSNEAGDGSVGNPWQTITYASTQTGSGDTIHVLPGTYNAALGETFPITLEAGVRFLSETTGLATIDSETAAVDTLYLNSNTTLEGFYISNSASDGYMVYVVGSSAEILNNTIVQGGGAVNPPKALYVEHSADNCLFQGNTVSAGSQRPVSFVGVNNEPLDGLIIRDNAITCSRSDYETLYLYYATDSLIEGNTITSDRAFYHNTQWNIPTDTTIRNNTLEAYSTYTPYGIYLYGPLSGTFASNEVRGYEDAATAGYASVVYAGSGTFTIEGNTVVKNDRGILVSAGTVTIKNNIVSAAPSLGSYFSDSVGVLMSGGSATSDYNCIWNNADAYDGVTAGSNDIFACPKFVDPDNDDYHIFSDSPCNGTADDSGNRGRYGTDAGSSGITTEAYVDAIGGNDSTGDGSLGSPWKTITHALSTTEGTINAMDGLYDISNNSETFPFVLADGVTLKNYSTDVATIDSESDNNHTVIMGAHSTLEGLTLNNDKTATYYCVNAIGTSAQILNNEMSSAYSVSYLGSLTDGSLIEGNTIHASGYSGFGIKISGPNLTIQNNTIEASGAQGFGIYTESVGFNIKENLIFGSGTGGYYGIYNNVAANSGTIESNVIRDFKGANGFGIRTYVGSGREILINKNTIVKNNIGVHVGGSGSTNVRNCIIASDPDGGTGSGTGIKFFAGSLDVTYCDVYGNATDYDSVTPGVGTISATAQFADAANDDYHLNYNSPCIDSGDPSETDPDGTRVEMGRYYFDLTQTGTMAVYVKTPNGGESLTGGTTYEISWYATKEGTPYDHIEIHYSTDSGSTYPNLITGETENDGSYLWDVPSNVETDQARVRVGAFGSAATDESDGDFEIIPPNIYYVSAEGGSNVTGDGSSGNPWQTISWALAQVGAGDVIRAMPGLYNASMSGSSESFPITVEAGVKLEGATTRLATIDVDANGIDAVHMKASSTLEGFTVKATPWMSAKCVYVLGANAEILDNYITPEGSATGIPYAIYNFDGYSDLRIEDNDITGRSRYAMRFKGSGLVLRNNTITNIGSGGDIYAMDLNDSSAPVIQGNHIKASKGIYASDCPNLDVRENTIEAFDLSFGNYGMYLLGSSSGNIVSNEVRGFYAVDFLLGIYLYQGGPYTVEHNTIVKNKLGILVYSGDAAIKNNIIAAAPGLGSAHINGSRGIYRNGSGSVTSDYNCIWNNTQDYYNVSAGANDVSACPRFVDADNDDYRIFSDSPCAGAADDGGNMGRYASVGGSSGIISASYVDDDAPNEGGDGSIGSPWKTISHAIASTEGTIYVRAGTYDTAHEQTYKATPFPMYLSQGTVFNRYLSESVNISANVSDNAISCASNVTVEGFNLNNSGSGTGTAGIYLNGDNITIRNNNISAEVASTASGIEEDHSSQSISNIVIDNNRINAESRGIYLYTYVDNVNITNNTIIAGDYAIDADGASASSLLNNISIQNNTLEATDSSAARGVRSYYCLDLVVKDNIIIGPGGTYGSGGVYTDYSSGTIEANEIRDFVEYNSGYGVRAHVYGGREMFVLKNTIVKNKNGVRVDANTVTIRDNIISVAPGLGQPLMNYSTGVYHSTGTTTSEYNCAWNNFWDHKDISAGPGCISACPRFVDAENNDYRLYSDSPCVGTASDSGNIGRYGSVGTASGIISNSYVDDNAADESGDGSLGNPWKTISHAVVSTEGTINVRAGNYDETHEQTYKATPFPMYLSAGTYLKRYQQESAVISGNASSLIVPGNNVTIEGFDIRNSGASTATTLRLNGSNLTIKDNIITAEGGNAYAIQTFHYTKNISIEGNQINSPYYGIKLYYDNDNMSIIDNTLTSGYYGVIADGSTGIYVSNDISIQNNTFEVTGAGAVGIWADGWYDFDIRGNTIIGPGGATGSHGIDTYAYCSGTIEANEIRGFRHPNDGYGIRSHVESGKEIRVNKNTILGNKRGVLGSSGITFVMNSIVATNEIVGITQSSGTITSTYNCLYNNTATYGASVLDKTGDIYVDPKFVDADNDDYHLRNNSPCIDTGDPNPIYNDSDGTRADMGAYPYLMTAGVPPACRVLTPNGGESWGANYSEDITWYATQPADVVYRIDLYYSADDGNSWNEIATDEANDGTYQWTVANEPTTEALVKVVAFASIGTDESDSNFTIFSTDSVPPTIEVTAPVTGEAMRGGSTYNITWTITDESGIKADSLNIYYSVDGGSTFPHTIVSGTTESDDTYPWTVAAENTIEARLRITAKDALDNLGTGESHGSFTIDSTGPSTPALLTPTNGSIVAIPTPTFTWTAATDNITGVASYELRLDGTSRSTTETTYYWSTILSEAIHTWEVRAFDGVGNPGSFSTSFTFEVDTLGPNVTGEVIRDRNTLKIGYTNDRIVSIEALGVSGSPTQMLLSQNSNFSGASWRTYQNPTTFEISAGDGAKTVYYKLRDAVLNPSATVEANIALDTQPPSVAVSKPSPWGEVLMGGMAYDIRWQANDSASGIASDGIDIYYSANSGVDGYPYEITREVSNTGSYSWMVPELNGQTFMLKITARDNAGNSRSAPSEDNFIIKTVLSTISIVSPEAGGAVPGGSSYDVTYTLSTEVGWATPVTIRHTTDEGASWVLDTTSGSTTSIYPWSVPAVNSELCYISMEAEDNAQRMARALSGKFAIDSISPEVSGVQPPDKEEDVNTDGTNIVINFDEPMDEQSVQDAFSIDPQITGRFSWSSDGRTLTLTPDTVLRGDAAYTVRIGVGARDRAGNPLKSEKVSAFRTAAPVETVPPTVIIKIKGTALKSGDYIPAQPSIEVSANDNFQIVPAGVNLFVDNSRITAAAFRALSIASVEVMYAVPAYEPLAVGAHSIKVVAIDAAGNITTKEVTNLKVVDEGEELKLDYVISYPMTFKPGKGEISAFSYILNKDADITIYVYGPAGEISWTRKYPAGTMGGQAGYNMVEFSGISDISGSPLANGIYVFKIIHQNQVKGTGYIVVYE